MEQKDIKTGQYIKWVAHRQLKSWNAYGKILEVSKDKVKLITFDDFQETEIWPDGEAMNEEISLATKEEAEKYLESKIHILVDAKDDAFEAYKKQVSEINNKIKATKKQLLK